MNHFSPRPSQKKRDRHLENEKHISHIEEPAYILYNIGISNLRPRDKIKRYWISFRDPVNLKKVEETLRKHFPVTLHGYAGVFQTEQVYTCWVELDEYMNWLEAQTYTIAALLEVC